jgi:hypothetical protein
MVRVAWVTFGIPLSVQELRFLVIGEHLGDGFTMYRELYDHTGPLSALIYKYLDILFGRNRWAHIIFSSMLVIVQAGLFNNILLRNKAYDENTYVPAFLYVMLICGTMDFMALSPQLMALTFILLALNHVFRRIDNVVTDELFMYSGVYLGIATFFYLPAVMYLIMLLLSLVLFSTAVLRRLLIFLYAAAVVFLVIWAYYFWYGANNDFILSFFQAGIMKPGVALISYSELWSVGAVLGVISVVSFSVIFTQRLTTFQQKMQQVMIMMFLAGVVVILLTKDLSSNELVLLVPSITFFLTYYLLGLRRKIWKFSVPYIVIIALIGYPFYWLNTHQNSNLIVDENATSLKGEQLMGIGVPVDFYANNKLAGPFLDNYISQKELIGLDYLEGASVIYNTMNHSNPTIIVDRLDVIPKIFSRLPKLRSQYEEVDSGIYRRKNQQ